MPKLASAPQQGVRPRTITQNDDGTFQIAARAGDPAYGQRVHIELQNPANAAAIYTVPSGKTFTGTVILNGTVAAGTIGVSAATGGVQAQMTGVGSDVVDVQIAGGAGNALTAVVAAGGLGSIIIDGWVK